jgi:serine/threonine protein kinase
MSHENHVFYFFIFYLLFFLLVKRNFSITQLKMYTKIYGKLSYVKTISPSVHVVRDEKYQRFVVKTLNRRRCDCRGLVDNCEQGCSEIEIMELLKCERKSKHLFLPLLRFNKERTYFISPLCNNTDVFDLVQNSPEKGHISPSETGRLMNTMVQAVLTLHRFGLCHRDIKPENMFLHRKENSLFYIVLGDFGLTAASSLTNWRRCGTKAYQAPEVSLKFLCGPASDVYSLGLTLYFFLFHCLPWTSSKKRLTGTRKPEVVPFPQTKDSLPKKWLDMIAGMLCLNPSNRINLNDVVFQY